MKWSPRLGGRNAKGGSMKLRKIFLRTGIVVVSAFCLIVFQVSLGALLNNSPAYAQPFATLPPNTATVDPAGVGGTPLGPTPFPTIGPSQFFQEDNKPDVVSKTGDDEFGYGQVVDKPGVYLVWTTDERGTHYYSVDLSSDQFYGGTLPDDFDTLIQRRTEKLSDIHTISAEIDSQKAQRRSSSTYALVAVGLGAVACMIVTLGGCALPFAAAALGLVGKAGTHLAAANSAEAELDRLNSELADIDQSLRGRYSSIVLTQP